MVGVSAAANVAAALQVAQRLEQGIVVTILCDSAARYLSERFWEEPGSSKEQRTKKENKGAGRTENREPRTRTENREPRTENREPRTENRVPLGEQRTKNA